MVLYQRNKLITSTKYVDIIKSVWYNEKQLKEVLHMARKPFNTSVEETILAEFKQKCENAQPKLPYSTVLEILMDWYNKGNLEVTTNVEITEKGK